MRIRNKQGLVQVRNPVLYKTKQPFIKKFFSQASVMNTDSMKTGITPLQYMDRTLTSLTPVYGFMSTGKNLILEVEVSLNIKSKSEIPTCSLISEQKPRKVFSIQEIMVINWASPIHCNPMIILTCGNI